MLGNIGPLEIGIVLVIALLVFGPRRLPEFGSGLGRGMREFKRGVTGESVEGGDVDRLAVEAAPEKETVATSERPQ